MRTGTNNHQKYQQKCQQKNDTLAHWDDFGVIWAKNPNKGYDLLVLATNNPADVPGRRWMP